MATPSITPAPGATTTTTPSSTPAASGTTTGASGSATTNVSPSGFVVIQVGTHTFTLSGTLRKPQASDITRKLPAINVSYKQDFDASLNLGILPSIVGTLAQDLGLADLDPAAADLSTEIQSRVSGVPVVGDIINTAQIRITELTIDSATDPTTALFRFGIGLDLTDSPTKLGPIKVQAVGVTIQFTRTNPAK